MFKIPRTDKPWWTVWFTTEGSVQHVAAEELEYSAAFAMALNQADLTVPDGQEVLASGVWYTPPGKEIHLV